MRLQHLLVCGGVIALSACADSKPAASAAATESTGAEAPPPAPPAPPPPRPVSAVPAPIPATSPAAWLDSEERSEEDRALDPQRKPAELLAFAGIEPGMRVAELAAGGGYTTELLARAVGSDGQVYAQNSPFILKRFAEGPFSARLQKPIMSRVTRVDSEFDAPLPDIAELDRVLMALFYHDTVWFKTDRAAMNKAIYNSLKPGGQFIIVDHNARSGDGVSQAKSLHRIEESVVVKEVTAAGFELDASSDFLRNEHDPRDWNASPSSAGERRGSSDRFALRFIKR